MRRKQVDDVMGGEGAWDNVDHTEVQCPVHDCGGERAYFYMVQIRSADEPMTTFYKVSLRQSHFGVSKWELVCIWTNLLFFTISVQNVDTSGERVERRLSFFHSLWYMVFGVLTIEF